MATVDIGEWAGAWGCDGVWVRVVGTWRKDCAGRTGQVLHCAAVGACGCASSPQWKCSGLKIDFLLGRLFPNPCLFMVPVYSVVPETPCHIEENELQHRDGKG